MNSLNGGRWECSPYETVPKHFEEVKKLDRHLLYNYFAYKGDNLYYLIV